MFVHDIFMRIGIYELSKIPMVHLVYNDSLHGLFVHGFLCMYLMIVDFYMGGFDGVSCKISEIYCS